MADDHPTDESKHVDDAGADRDATLALTGQVHVGDMIGPYRILEQIGEGGFGIVYLAEQTQPVRRRVALKIIKPGMDSKAVVARFEAERQALAVMDHPNIARVFDGGMTERGYPYFVMELVQGEPITDFCDRHKVDIDQRLRLFIQVCRAVHHAHMKGLIHRDISPSNVLVTYQDGQPVPKVIDFGVAKALNQGFTDKTVFTQRGQMIGKPAYMSPEQAEMGGLDIDTRSDVYSLGVLLYELLTGVTPFDSNALRRADDRAIQRMIWEDEPPAPLVGFARHGDAAARVAECRRTSVEELKRILNREPKWILSTAMQKDRAHRYRSADALADDVQRYLEGLPIVGRPPSAWYIGFALLCRIVRRHRWASVITAMLITALLVETLGMKFTYTWTPVNDWYRQMVAGLPWPAHAPENLGEVTIVRISQSTQSQIEQLADQFGIEGVSARSAKTWRAVHGQFMKRLADAGVRTVVWDIAFTATTDHDQAFLDGLLALKQANIPVVIGVPAWRLDSDGLPEINARFRPHVRWGCADAGFFPSQPWQLYLCLQRGLSSPMPSLGLAAVAAHRQPDERAAIRLSPSASRVHILYYRPNPKDPRQRVVSGEDVFTASTVRAVTATEAQNESDVNLKPGDLFAPFIFDLPPTQTIERSAVDYQWVMTAPAEDVARRLNGQMIVLGYTFDPNDMWHHADGRTLPGCYGHAAGIAALLADRAVLIQRTSFRRWVLWPVAVVLGALIGARLARRRFVRALALLCLAGVVFLICVIVYHALQYRVNPFAPIFAIILSSELAAGVFYLSAGRTRGVVS